MGFTEIFFLVLFLVGAGAVGWTVYAKNHPKHITSFKKPKKTRPDEISRPKDAWEQGYRDMMWAIYEMMFKKPIKYEFRFRVENVWNNPVKEMSELIVEAKIVQRYRDFDIKKGRSSRKYLSSNSSEEFAQYVLGGRTVLDQFDDAILRILEEKELAKARQEGLETFDNQYNSVRKSLGIIRDKDYRVLTEHEEFEKQMRGIEDGKKNKT